ncbi:asparaginase [Cereibacter azotoformans]|uniref:L-asparaginase n=1 Tax=Cereibacter azotoformans TaxID=43057 RepID=A0A2T5K614_9RHOB|nr:asparaginase [Cereibacter azotoformans]AXQ95606.1 asparaginase [Cereibacter sphaeroides]PTR17798.1 L-asparaginase [Cereibacter azotoformans]UIJ32143.1 asparaginase [Cereibacter azotoformans]
MTEQAHIPKVAVIVGGGTLTALAHDPFEIRDYGQAGSLTAAELIARCGAISDRVALVPLDFTPLPSFDMGPAQWLALCRLCEEALRAEPDLAGFVLTHGTGSLEEAAFFLSLVWDLPVPLVVTGAQRPASALGSDGYMNFFQAARVAACPEARPQRVLVVLHGEIHRPAEVTKTHNFGLDSFRSPDLGPVGLVIGGEVRLGRAPALRAPLLDWRGMGPLPRVDILHCHSGGDACAIEAFIAAGARAIVAAGFAPGYATSAQAARLEVWIRDAGGLVVMASRAAGSVVATSRNDGHGFLPAGRHSPVKARLLLQLALAAGLAPAEIARQLAS